MLAAAPCLEVVCRRDLLWLCPPPLTGAATGTLVGLSCASSIPTLVYTNTRSPSTWPSALRCLCVFVIERRRDLGGNLIKEIAEGAFQGLKIGGGYGLGKYNGYDVML